jgi:uncharacterized iron-regulated protein
MPRILLYLTLVFSLQACRSPAPEPPDPLTNRIFETATQTELSRDDLSARLRDADVIYLGEEHDQAEHHRLQLAIIESLLGSGLRPAIGFELFSLEQTSTLMTYTQRKSNPHQVASGHSAEEWLRGEFGWKGEENSYWQFYGPLLQIARQHNLTVFGADLHRSIRKRLSKTGIKGLTAVESQLIHGTGFSDENYRKLMYARFKAAHCGWGSDDYFSRLYDTWLARNDTMAGALVSTLRAEEGRPVVLITGAGHTQYNMGVYERVRHLDPDVKQINVGLRALADEKLPLDTYLQSTEFDGQDYGMNHQYQWFTATQFPAAEDPCKAFLAVKQKQDQK